MKDMRQHSMMRLGPLAIGVALLLAASLAGANGVGEEGSGTLVTERLALSGFTGIEVAGSWQVTVRPGPYDVQVTVDDNVIDDLRVEVRGDALHFGLRPQVRLRRVTLRAQVTMPALDAVGVSGSGEATFSEFESPALRIRVTGSGDVEGSGITVDALAAGISGSGDISLEGCAIESADDMSIRLRLRQRRPPRVRVPLRGDPHHGLRFGHADAGQRRPHRQHIRLGRGALPGISGAGKRAHLGLRPRDQGRITPVRGQLTRAHRER